MPTLRFCLIACVLLLLLAACKRQVRHTPVVAQTAVQESIVTSTWPTAEERAEWDRQEILDSIYMNKVFASALDSAKKEMEMHNNFAREYTLPPNDSFSAVVVSVKYGHIFNSTQKHLLVRRLAQPGAYIDVMQFTGKRFVPVIQNRESPMAYIRDTIEDVNGDGYGDLLVQWYPSAGCCLRNIYRVFVSRPDGKHFEPPLSFINPTFSATEKIVRGIGYGQPGETELYKYRWNGCRIDTVEYIYRDPEDTSHHDFYRTDKPIEEPGVKKRKIAHVPVEYRSITDFDWFGDF